MRTGMYSISKGNIAMKKLIYLANSYSSKLLDPDAAALQRAQRRHLEAFIAGKLRKMYDVAVIAPIALSAAMADICQFGTGFDEWEGDDITFISKCDELWVLTSDGWQDSQGVTAEIDFARTMNIPVKYIHPKTIKLANNPDDFKKLNNLLDNYDI